MDIFDTISGLYGEIEDDGESNMEVMKDRPHLENVEDGQEFEFKGIKFVRLGQEQGGVLCITKDDFYPSIRFNRNENNNYKESEIRRKILEDFLPRLEGTDILPYEMDLIADNGETEYGICTDQAGILTYDLYRKYRRFVLPLRGYTWTCTPYACDRNNQYVRVVFSSGYVGTDFAGNAYRCRPACIFAI